MAVVTIIFLCSLLWFAYRRTMRYMRQLQQEFYYTAEYLSRIVAQRAFDRRATVVLGVTALLIIITNSALPLLLTSIALIILAMLEEDPRVSGKLRLTMTPRLTRTLWLSLLLTLIVTAIIASVAPSALALTVAMILVVQLLPLAVAAANSLLVPVERYIQDHYRREARELWATIKPMTIGITGSYGKTSVKGILTSLLSTTHSAVYAPPDGVNSLMGITRDIREQLRPQTNTAIIEMGAYHRGSISRLCQLTPPQAAIITAVAPMHLERFGSIEVTYKAKSELAQALPTGGLLVLNGDNEGTRRMAAEFSDRHVLIYGLDASKGHLDCHATDLMVSQKGTTFVLTWQGQSYTATTPLVGTGAVSNILAAFTLAASLGARPDWLIGAIAHLRPVKNRLELKADPLGVTLHDAYNSNPRGFEDALWVLKQLPGEQRILMTPGMIELGSVQDQENEIIAAKAAEICDVVILVGATNRAALLRGLAKASRPELQVLPVSTRDEGFAAIGRIRRPNSNLLIENDLPDIYEGSSYGY